MDSDSPDKSIKRQSTGVIYQHGQLLESEFRILELSPGEFEDEIRCELRHEPEGGVYEALSYTWGSDTSTRKIWCSGKHLHVRINLYQALRYLRFKDRVRRVWIDAICINQFDVLERNQHVQRMDSVYAGAKRVLVWLGKSEEGVEILPNWLGWYPPHVDWYAANISWDTNLSFSFSSNLSKAATEWLQLQQIHLTPVLRFFARRWFSRKWIIQEIVHAKDALILCGQKEIAWETVRSYFAVSQDKFTLWHNSLARIFDQHPDKEFVNGANDGIFNCRQLARMTNKASLWNVIYDTNDFQCTEARDNLFALLGVAGDVRGELRVDYSEPIGLISVNYCRWLLNNDPYPLICFRTVEGSRGCSMEVPSWTPNIVPATWLARPDLRRPLSSLEYNAGGSQPTWTLTGRILSIKGIITETVTRVIPPPYVDITKPGWLHFGQEHSVWFKKCYEIVADPDLMYMLLTCGAEKARFADKGDWQSPSLETCKRWLDVVLSEEPNVYADAELSAMTTAIVYAKWRQFCVTSKNRYGWVPGATTIGDKICVLYGGKVPLAIGECEKGHHNLMGEAYIHGIMYGEALSGEDEIINLC